VVPSGWIRERVFIRFGAVFHIATVWVNGACVGSHVGGFLPFAFDVTDHLTAGANQVEVRADTPIDDPESFPDASFAEIPYGKQNWYGPLSGIWQSVWLERRMADHIARVRILPELESGRVTLRVFPAHPLASETVLRVAIRDPAGAEIAALAANLAQGSNVTELTAVLPSVQRWSPASPALYTAAFAFERKGEVADAIEERFGFRRIEARDGRLYLNGEPIFLRGALDQDYYPDTICTTPSAAFLEDEFRKAKELGLNCLRCHIKAPDPRYYETADRLGLLVWTELPNMGVSTERSRARKIETLKGIVDRDGNHPSIICWTIINENWGVDLVHDPEHRAWLKQTYRWLKSYDPGRLVVDNSPLAPSFHVQSDIADCHYYAAFPDNRVAWDRFVTRLAERADWLFGDNSDSVPKGDEPLMCSEFGNWGLPDPERLKDDSGREPWWFETGHDWCEGVMYPHGVENRFNDWSLSRVFGNLRGFIEAAQWQQFRALKYEIEAMRRAPSIAGYVITELTDAHWESNGLLDMRRNRRVFHDVFRAINSDTVIVPRWRRLSYWAGEVANIDVAIAHGSGSTLRGTRLEITFGHTTRLDLPEQAPGTVAALGEIELRIPDAARPAIERIAFELKSASGAVIARNWLDVAIHPRTGPARGVGPLWSPSVELRAHCDALGYETTEEPDPEALWIATALDAEVAKHVRLGGRLLLLPEAEMTLSPLFPHWQNVAVRERAGSSWQGDWASCFGWLHRGPAFARLPGGPLLDETFDRVLPTAVISGCNLLDFQARVHAGMVVGWIHKPVGLAVERGYGRGRLVVSTFRLFRDEPGADPTATELLRCLLALARAEGSAATRERAATLGATDLALESTASGSR
jgi:hypothetical protein